MRIKENINILMELAKVRITMFVAISTSVGYVLYSGKFDFTMIMVGIGVFILASASSALNHFQERNYDGLMSRTKNRPIPSGRIAADKVLVISLSLLAIGSIVLLIFTNVTASILGWIAFIWYNLIYTPLKRRYAMAVVPGSVIGAIPPVIGWVAAGGPLYSPQALALGLFFFIWQIPHFWLLLLIYGNDYIKAGFPVLTQKYDTEQIARMTFMWIIALSTSCLLIPLFGLSQSVITIVLLLFIGASLVLYSRRILKSLTEIQLYRKAFIYVNLYVLLAISILTLDALLF